MSSELIINASVHETRLAILENDRLVELYIEQASQHALAGGIFKGRVTRVLPGMQSAFVNIGLERDAFLYVTDFFTDETEAVETLPVSTKIKSVSGSPADDNTAPSSETISIKHGETETNNWSTGKTARNRNANRKNRSRWQQNVTTQKKTVKKLADKGQEPGTEPKFAVLPGESLAKYKHAPQSSTTTSADSHAHPQDHRARNLTIKTDRHKKNHPRETNLTRVKNHEKKLPEPIKKMSIFSVIKQALGFNNQVLTPEKNTGGAAVNINERHNPIKTKTSRQTVTEKNSITLVSQKHSKRDRSWKERHKRHRIKQQTGSTRNQVKKRTAESTKISDLIKKDQEILVQISKEPLGKKGARITSRIALPGRFLIYMPTVDHIGVSRKISSDKERSRLRAIVQNHNTGMVGGFIVRTAGEGVTAEDLRSDMSFLYNLWLEIREKSAYCPPSSLVHHDDDLIERILRDRLGENFKTIWVDGEEEYERILRFVERFQPNLTDSIKLYTRKKPIFDSFNINLNILFFKSFFNVFFI